MSQPPPVLVDTNAVIEAVRTACWAAPAHHFRLETVEQCRTEAEQTPWLLFLKYLDDLEREKKLEAELDGRDYGFILEPAYRWESWATPRDAGGALDHNRALTGDDLRDFVNGKLFPYLHGFEQRAAGPNTIEYKIGRSSAR